MLQFRRLRTRLALAVGSAGLAIGLTSGALAITPSAQDQTTTPSSQTEYSARDKILVPNAHIIPLAPPPPGSIPSNLINFDAIAPGGRTAEVRADIVAFVFRTGWTQVTRVGIGDYCLNGAGFNYPATVSVASRSGLPTRVFGYIEYDSFGARCSGVEVHTYQLT